MFKSILPLMMATSMLFSCSHQANRFPAQDGSGVDSDRQIKTYTCSEIYEMKVLRKQTARNKYNARWNENDPNISLAGGPASKNNAIMVTGFLVGGVAFGGIGAAAAVIAPLTISKIKNLKSSSEKGLLLREEASKEFKKFLKKVHKKISQQITPEEIHEILQTGFDSGLYCEDLPKLASHKTIQKHIFNVLKLRYNPALAETYEEALNIIAKRDGFDPNPQVIPDAPCSVVRFSKSKKVIVGKLEKENWGLCSRGRDDSGYGVSEDIIQIPVY